MQGCAPGRRAGARRNGAGCGRREGRNWPGFPRSWESEEIEKNFATFNLIYFAMEMGQRGGNHYGEGQGVGIKGTGRKRFRTPCPPSLPHIYLLVCYCLFSSAFITKLAQIKAFNIQI